LGKIAFYLLDGLAKKLCGLLLHLLRRKTGRQRVELARRQVGRIILVTIQQVHDAAKGAAHFVERMRVVGALGDAGRVTKSSGGCQLRGLGVKGKRLPGLGLYLGLALGLRLD
jgi:hypothetical protein